MEKKVQLTPLEADELIKKVRSTPGLSSLSDEQIVASLEKTRGPVFTAWKESQDSWTQPIAKWYLGSLRPFTNDLRQPDGGKFGLSTGTPWVDKASAVVDESARQAAAGLVEQAPIVGADLAGTAMLTSAVPTGATGVGAVPAAGLAAGGLGLKALAAKMQYDLTKVDTGDSAQALKDAAVTGASSFVGGSAAAGALKHAKTPFMKAVLPAVAGAVAPTALQVGTDVVNAVPGEPGGGTLEERAEAYLDQIQDPVYWGANLIGGVPDAVGARFDYKRRLAVEKLAETKGVSADLLGDGQSIRDRQQADAFLKNVGIGDLDTSKIPEPQFLNLVNLLADVRRPDVTKDVLRTGLMDLVEVQGGLTPAQQAELVQRRAAEAKRRADLVEANKGTPLEPMESDPVAAPRKLNEEAKTPEFQTLHNKYKMIPEATRAILPLHDLNLLDDLVKRYHADPANRVKMLDELLPGVPAAVRTKLDATKVFSAENPLLELKKQLPSSPETAKAHGVIQERLTRRSDSDDVLGPRYAVQEAVTNLVQQSDLAGAHPMEQKVVIDLTTRLLNSIKFDKKDTKIRLRSAPFMRSDAGGLWYDDTHKSAKQRTAVVQSGGDFNWTSGIAAHELAHGAFTKILATSPDKHARIISEINAIPTEQKKVILTDVIKALGLDQSDADFINQKMVEYGATGQTDKTVSGAAPEEFISVLVQALVQHEMRSVRAQGRASIQAMTRLKSNWILRNIPRAVTAMLAEVQRVLVQSVKVARDYLAGNKQARKNITQALDMLRPFVEADFLSRKAEEVLGGLEDFDPTAGTYEPRMREYLSQFKSGKDPLETSTKLPKLPFSPKAPNAVSGELGGKKLSMSEDQFFSMLALANRYPFFRPVFDVLRDFRRRIKENTLKHYAYLGGRDGVAPSEKDLLNFQSRLLNLPEGVRKKIESAIEKNQNELGAGRAAMDRAEFERHTGLTGDDAEFGWRLTQVTNRVAYDEMVTQLDINANNVANLIYRHPDIKGKLPPAELASRVRGWFRSSFKYYQLLKEKDLLGKKPEEVEAIKNTDPDLKMASDYLEATIRDGLKDLYQARGTYGEDGFISQIAQSILAVEKARYAQAELMTKVGYAPRIRRGRYQVAIKRTEIDGTETRARYGFENVKDAQAMQAKEQAAGNEVQVYDMELLEDRYRALNPMEMDDIRQRAKAELREVIERFKQTMDPNDPAAILYQDGFDVLMSEYDPLASDVRDAIAVKGDKFAQRRKDIEGWKEEDYLPNIIDYIDYKTSKTQKGLARSTAKLEMLRPEYDSVVGLKERAQRVTDYALSSDNPTWGAIRKGTFYYYLAASIRHLVQNSFQNFVVGIPHMTKVTGNYHKSVAAYVKAFPLVTQYLLHGKTGHANLDKMLELAEQHQILSSSTVDTFIDPDAQLRAASSPTLRRVAGLSKTISKAKVSALKSKQVVESFLRMTSDKGERFNRVTAFITRANQLAGGKPLSNEELYAKYHEAKRFTDDVNFVGDRANRPGVFQDIQSEPVHGAALTLSAMQSYLINHLSLLASYTKKGSLAGKFDLRSPEGKGLAAGLLHIGLVAGSMGLPFMRDLDGLFQEMFGTGIEHAIRTGALEAADVFDWDEETGEDLGDMAVAGIPGLMGLDASSSLGLGSIGNYSAGMSPGEWGGKFALGATGSALVKIAEGTKHLVGGDVEQAVRVGAPQAFKYWQNLHEAAILDEVRNPKGQPTNPKSLDDSDMLAVAAGFRPISVSKQNNMVQTVLRLDRNKRASQTSAQNRIARLLAEGQTERAAQMAQEYLAEHTEVSPAQFVAGVSDEKRQRESGVAFSSPNLRTVQSINQARESVPSTSYPVSSPVQDRLARLAVSQELQQPLVTLQQIDQLRSGLLRDVLAEQVTQAGLSPEYLRLLQSRSAIDLNRLSLLAAELQSGGRSAVLR